MVVPGRLPNRRIGTCSHATGIHGTPFSLCHDAISLLPPVMELSSSWERQRSHQPQLRSPTKNCLVISEGAVPAGMGPRRMGPPFANGPERGPCNNTEIRGSKGSPRILDPNPSPRHERSFFSRGHFPRAIADRGKETRSRIETLDENSSRHPRTPPKIPNLAGPRDYEEGIGGGSRWSWRSPLRGDMDFPRVARTIERLPVCSVPRVADAGNTVLRTSISQEEEKTTASKTGTSSGCAASPSLPQSRPTTRSPPGEVPPRTEYFQAPQSRP